MVRGYAVYNERGIEIIRSSLENLRQFGFEHGLFSQNRNPRGMTWDPLQTMLPEHRHEFAQHFALRDRQTTATIHLESMELPDSQRVIVEIRETGDDDDDDIGANLPTLDE